MANISHVQFPFAGTRGTAGLRNDAHGIFRAQSGLTPDVLLDQPKQEIKSRSHARQDGAGLAAPDHPPDLPPGLVVLVLRWLSTPEAAELPSWKGDQGNWSSSELECR